MASCKAGSGASHVLDNDSLTFQGCTKPWPVLEAWQLSVERQFSLILGCSEAYKAPLGRRGERRDCNNAGFRPRGISFELPRLELCGLARRQANIHFSVPRYVEYCSAFHSSFLFIANNSLNLSHWTYLGAYLGGLGVTSRGGAALP